MDGKKTFPKTNIWYNKVHSHLQPLNLGHMVSHAWETTCLMNILHHINNTLSSQDLSPYGSINESTYAIPQETYLNIMNGVIFQVHIAIGRLNTQ